MEKIEIAGSSSPRKPASKFSSVSVRQKKRKGREDKMIKLTDMTYPQCVFHSHICKDAQKKKHGMN